ncbi:hypothetical protein UlMin_006488 [Ulmus minor]
MVQRKVSEKLGINQRADHLRHEKRLASLKKPSFSQYQEGKTRGSDLKKKMMKKTRALKLPSDIDQSLRKNISQPGKPPPLRVSTTSTTQIQQKQPLIIKTVDGSPNYMKSTSCFDARKEQSQVSIRNSQACLDAKNHCGKNPSNLKHVHSSASSSNYSKNKPAKSLKVVRTITKTPSFKKSKDSSKKCSSKVALCASDHDDLNVQRATCSSTLKDSKFPSYLMLNPGGTECEGTSALKVCPYTYCSLNGHRHASLPPLKLFMVARRRSLKNQKSVKLQALSPRKAMARTKEEKLAQKVDADFFVEIFAKSKEDEEEKKMDFVSSKVGGEEEETDAEKYVEKQVVESLSDGSPKSEVDIEEMEITSEGLGSIEVDEDSCSEASEMEWEEGKISESEREEEAYSSSQLDDGSETISGCSSEIESGADLNELLEKAYEDESAIFEGEFNEQDQRSCTDEAFEDSSTVEENCGQEETDPMYYMVAEASMEEMIEETKNTTEVTEEDSTDYEEHNGSQEIESLETEKEVDTGEFDVASDDLSEETEKAAEADEEKVAKVDEDTRNNTTTELRHVEEYPDSGNSELNLAGNEEGKNEGEVNESRNIEAVEIHIESNKQKITLLDEEEKSKSSNSWKRGTKRAIKDSEEPRKFNPREPNYLPLVEDPEGEKVDLKHQMIDERKNTEEWMIDYALQQAVTKLAPARKRKVALLVEAFETVLPIPKFESHHLRHRRHHPSPAFTHSAPIQACS